MTNLQAFGRASALAPPIMVDGTAYALALRFLASSESDEPDGQTVVSGWIDAVESLGSGRFRVVCRRASIPFSVTRVIPGYGGHELVYQAVCGTNVANTPEPLRLYSWLAPGAVRGDQVGQRAEPRDMLWAGPPGAERSAFIEQALPLAYPPIGGVNYASDEPQPTVSYLALDFADVFLPAPDRAANPEAAIDITLDAGFFADAGVYIEQTASPGTYTKLTRKTFVGPSDSDPDLYPSGATLAQGEFWIDPQGYEIRLSSHNANIGSAGGAVYYERGIHRLQGVLPILTLEGTGGAGYDFEGAADETVGAVISTRGNWNTAFFLYQGGAEGYGAGAIEWSFPTANRKAALVWVGGVVTGVLARLSDGGPMIPQSFTPMTFPANFANIAVEKFGSEVSFRDVATGTLIAAVDLGLPERIYGQLGVHTWGSSVCQFLPPGDAVERIGTSGDLIAQRIVLWPSLTYSKDYRLPVGTNVQSVVSQGSQGTYSSSGSARRRSHYQTIDAETLRFYCETAPDIVRVQQAASVEPPEPPGRAPRVLGIVNLATVDDPEDPEGIASEDQYENRANWHDVLVVHATDGTFPFGPGDPFTVRRGAVLDPRETWTLEYDLQGNGESDWTAVPTDAILPLVAEGVFLVSADWLDELEAVPCFRLSGTFITHHANLDARTANELAVALERLDRLWLPLSIGGPRPEIGGASAPLVDVGASAQACLGCDALYATSVAWGWLVDQVSFYAEHGLPGWYSDGHYYDDVGNVSPYTLAYAAETFQCCAPTGLFWSRGTQRTTEDWPVAINPGGALLGQSTEQNYFGTSYPTFSAGSPDFGGQTFYLAGTGISPASLASWPSGTECVEAKAIVLASNLLRWDWDFIWNFGRDHNGDLRIRLKITINGRVVFDTESVNGVELYDDGEGWESGVPGKITGRDEGEVGFELMGITRDAKNAVTRDTGDTLSVPDDRLISISGGTAIGGTIKSGKQSEVDVTNAVQALLSARTNRAAEFFLFPTRAGVTPQSKEGRLASFLKAIGPTLSASVTGTEDQFIMTSGSGSFTAFDSLQILSIHARLRPPSNVLDDLPIPHLPRGPMV